MKLTATALLLSFVCTLGQAAQTDTKSSSQISNIDGMNVHTVKWNDTPLRVALWHEEASGPRRQTLKESQVVLFVHGATISGKLSAGYPIDGYSWAKDVANTGRDAWVIDLPGYGRSDDYPEMRKVNAGTVADSVGNAKSLVPVLDAAVDYILQQSGAQKITIIATSRGAIPVGYYANAHPQKLDKVVFNSPIVRRDSTNPDVIKSLFGSAQRPKNNFYEIPMEQRMAMLSDDRPAGTDIQLEDGFVKNWPKDSLSERGTKQGTIKVPGGFAQDIYDAWHGVYWDPAKIEVPVLITRGDYDHVLTTRDDTDWLYSHLVNAPSKRFVLIDKGTHAMLFEKKRFELYREVQVFLDGAYTPQALTCNFCGGRN
jgi:pimeloyl-ACP methyl ester carboxylesterase